MAVLQVCLSSVAEVHSENTASIALFRAGGYAEIGLIDGFFGFKLAL